ncbi:MAG: hypothetical protein LBJ92_04440 [Holosporales bacterium]|jgi:hypothetical protein|nr:hypothetical protein [Holosporales bacterium]
MEYKKKIGKSMKKLVNILIITSTMLILISQQLKAGEAEQKTGTVLDYWLDTTVNVSAQLSGKPVPDIQALSQELKDMAQGLKGEDAQRRVQELGSITDSPIGNIARVLQSTDPQNSDIKFFIKEIKAKPNGTTSTILKLFVATLHGNYDSEMVSIQTAVLTNRIMKELSSEPRLFYGPLEKGINNAGPAEIKYVADTLIPARLEQCIKNPRIREAVRAEILKERQSLSSFAKKEIILQAIGETKLEQFSEAYARTSILEMLERMIRDTKREDALETVRQRAREMAGATLSGLIEDTKATIEELEQELSQTKTQTQQAKRDIRKFEAQVSQLKDLNRSLVTEMEYLKSKEVYIGELEALDQQLQGEREALAQQFQREREALAQQFQREKEAFAAALADAQHENEAIMERLGAERRENAELRRRFADFNDQISAQQKAYQNQLQAWHSSMPTLNIAQINPSKTPQ